jgi:predicted AlkP superfamily phosphohydrolase/phosphomutase
MAFLSFLDVDWSRSRAYSFGRHLGSIYVNVKGREPEGVVEPGAEYEAVRDEIEQRAREFRDPHTGRPLIGEVIRREEVYSGPYLDRAPDLILRPNDPSDIFFGLADFGHRNTVDTVYRYSGMHRDEGMIIMNGPSIQSGSTLSDAIISDVAPTVLHAMGLPVPAEMDGHILEKAFVPGYMELFPAAMLTAPDVGTGRGAVGSTESVGQKAVLDYTEEGEKEVLERLQGLGYLG